MEPVAQDPVHIYDDPLLFLGERSPLEVRPQIIDPPQPAALATPLQP